MGVLFQGANEISNPCLGKGLYYYLKYHFIPIVLRGIEYRIFVIILCT